MEHPFVIGTAGHIDHGKTSLVMAMTGIDCDRLAEEKRRGITIELGFAPLNLKDGKTVSIVDVPGHERFIRQMASGAAGMDAAMLIIAADEGVMPQTREHLDILNILGVRFGLIALTKKDLTDSETLEIAACEARELVSGTNLEDAAVIPVSAVTGEGISDIIEEIEKIIKKAPPRRGFGAFFLPIDRVFSVKGFGSVVTGTSYQGVVSEGDEVDIMPKGIKGKVRSLQAHGANVGTVTAGQRAAVNLSSISLDRLERGDVICKRGAFAATDCVSAWMDILASAPGPVLHGQRIHLHVGTSDVVAKISILAPPPDGKKPRIEPGQGGLVQIFPESKITAAAGQRFVIRFYSPLITIGGGRILLPNAEPARSRRERAAKAAITETLAQDFGPSSLLAAIALDKGMISERELLELSQMDGETFRESLDGMAKPAKKYGLLKFGAAGNFISLAYLEYLAQRALEKLREFHAKHPELAGPDADELAASLAGGLRSGSADARDLKALIEVMASRKFFSPVNISGRNHYAAPDFRSSLSGRFMEIVRGIEKAAESAGYKLVTMTELQTALGVSAVDMKRAAAYLREKQDMRIIADGMLFPRSTREQFRKILSSMNGEITISAARDATGASRKFLLPMLEFFDAQGVTKRIGDKRVLVL